MFSVGADRYTGLDVALSAMVRGDWAAFERRLTEGLACTLRAQAEKGAPPADALEQAATAFRYDRDLLAASEISEWLARFDLSTDDWTAYLARDLLRQRWRDSLDQTVDCFPPSAHQLAVAAFVDGVCSGTFDELTETFAARVALATGREPSANDDVSRAGEAARIARAHAHWLAGYAPEDLHVRLDRALTIEAHCADAIAEVIARARLDDVVEQHRLPWQQVELDTLRFSSEHAAREAVLCVTIDRLSLHDVAALSRHSSERTSYFADELDPDRRDLILGVTPGAILGPTAVNGHFEVSAVVRRTSPTLTDPRVAARARRTVVDAALRRAACDLVVRHSRD